MKVQDLVQSRHEVFSVQEDATIYEVARYLRDQQVRSVGVLDSAGHLAGVVPQRTNVPLGCVFRKLCPEGWSWFGQKWPWMNACA